MKPQNLFALSLLFVLTATGCGKQENEDVVKPTANVTENISVEDAIENDLNENFALGVGTSVSQKCKAKVESARKLAAQAFAQASQLEGRRQGLLASQSANPNISRSGELLQSKERQETIGVAGKIRRLQNIVEIHRREALQKMALLKRKGLS